MRGIRTLVTLGLALALGLAPAVALTVEGVVAKHIEARGGDAWKRIDTMKITGQYTAFSETHSLSLFLEISNLFNRDNDCCTEYEVDDETGELLLEIEAVNGLPFIPSAGFVWRF